MDKLLYTVDEACAITGLSRTTLYRLMTCDRLIAVKVGASRRIPRQNLQRFVDSLVAEARSDAKGRV